jgi:hypothetical protein
MPDSQGPKPQAKHPAAKQAGAKTQSYDQPALDAAHILTRLAIALLLIGVPLASILTVNGIYTLAPIGAALSLVAWALSPGARGLGDVRLLLTSQTGLIALFFLAWTAASLIWTPFGSGPVERFVKSAGVVLLLAAAAALLPTRTRTTNLYLLPIGVAIGAVAVIFMAVADYGQAVEAGFDGSLSRRVTFGLALLAWPALGALALRDKRNAALGLAILVVAAVLAARAPLGLSATAFGALALAGALADQSRASKVIGFGMAAILLFSPLWALAASYLWSMESAPAFLHGSILWGQFLRADDLHALTGHGFDAGRMGVAAGYLPQGTPRSLLFEIWFELGLVGAIAGALLLLTLARACGRMRPNLAPFGLGGLAASFVLCSFGLGLARVWWITLLALSGFAFAILRHGHARAQRPKAVRLPQDSNP